MTAGVEDRPTGERVTDIRSWSERFAAVMPFGSSTASKRPRLLPEEPEVIVRGDGCRVWDDRGREFIDFRNALGPVTLGYRYPAVDDAIRAQLDRGIIFGHPSPLECEVAERICRQVPGMEWARFLKTGGEAIAAAIRVARSHTGREHVIQIGYNGWLNSLGSGSATLPGRHTPAPAPAGVPAAVAALHHQARWNDLAQIEQILDEYPGQVAAVVVAADYAGLAETGTFYPQLRALLDRHGTLLILDEIVTGFRLAVGGVNEHFSANADLAVYGKGMANGMPIAVYGGRAELMASCGPDGAVISSTFGGEALSLAATAACLETYANTDVIGHLWRQGDALWSQVVSLFASHGIPLMVTGLPPCPVINATDDTPGLLDTFLQAAYRHGVSLYRVSYVNLSHSDDDIAETVERLDRACADVANVVNAR